MSRACFVRHWRKRKSEFNRQNCKTEWNQMLSFMRQE